MKVDQARRQATEHYRRRVCSLIDAAVARGELAATPGDVARVVELVLGSPGAQDLIASLAAEIAGRRH